MSVGTKVHSMQILESIIQKEPKERLAPDEADQMSLEDFIIRLDEELRIIRTTDDEQDRFAAIHQLRHLATTMLYSQIRRETLPLAS